jgi:hypothetical protein
MPQIPFCGPTYNGRSLNADASRCVNFYLENTGTQDNKSGLYLVGTPGTVVFSAGVGVSPIRGLHTIKNEHSGTDLAFAIIDSTLYSVSSAGALTSRGTLSSSTGRVCIVDNGISQTGVTGNVGGNQLMIVDGVDAYIFNVSTNVFYSITSYLNITFQTTTNTVTLANHNYNNGDTIVFSSVTTATTVTKNTIYYIINTTTNTFQLSLTSGGAAVTVDHNGTGVISSGWSDIIASGYVPEFVTYIDGYFIVCNGSMSIWVSEMYDGLKWNALATAAAVSSQDGIVAVFANHQTLFILKTHTTEIWTNTGTTTTQGCPFSRQSGAVFDYGCASKWSIARGGTGTFFLATQRMNNQGQVVGVAMITDYSPNIISTPSINYMISQDTAYSDYFAYCYSESGHVFYVCTSPATGGRTVVFDSTTAMWHERNSFADDESTIIRHLGNCYMYFNGKHYLGDYRSPSICELSSDYYSDNGIEILSFRTAQTVYDKGELENVFISMLAVDAETGVGTASPSVIPVTHFPAGWDSVHSVNVLIKADGTITAGAIISGTIQSSMILSWSNDGGHTWSASYPSSLGLEGKYKTRMRWRRIGYSNNRVFRITIKEAVKKIVLGGYIEVSK